MFGGTSTCSEISRDLSHNLENIYLAQIYLDTELHRSYITIGLRINSLHLRAARHIGWFHLIDNHRTNSLQMCYYWNRNE